MVWLFLEKLPHKTCKHYKKLCFFCLFNTTMVSIFLLIVSLLYAFDSHRLVINALCCHAGGSKLDYGFGTDSLFHSSSVNERSTKHAQVSKLTWLTHMPYRAPQAKVHERGKGHCRPGLRVHLWLILKRFYIDIYAYYS